MVGFLGSKDIFQVGCGIRRIFRGNWDKIKILMFYVIKIVMYGSVMVLNHFGPLILSNNDMKKFSALFQVPHS